MAAAGPLAGGVGAVLDPIVAIRRVLRIPAEGQASTDLVLGVAETREAAEALATRYREARFAERVFQLAWTQAQVALRLLNVSEQDAQVYARLAGSIVHAVQHRRAPAAVLSRNRRGQNALWVYGISGDVPFVLVRIAEAEHIGLVRDAVQAHAWFRAKGLAVELVGLVEDPSSYRQALLDAVVGLIASGHEAAQIDRPGGIFVRRGDQMPEDDRVLFQSMARVVMSGRAGTFAEQVERRPRGLAPVPSMVRRPSRAADYSSPAVQRDDLVFRNAHGGFTSDGREYVVVLNAGESTPAPWVNVLANEHFGTLVSERGSAYTWLENSHEYRLTPWHNDPVSDASGEAFWIRDEDSGRYWSPTHGPADGAGGWIVRHGLGYSVFEHREDGIASECWHYVAVDAPVKIVSIRLRNLGSRTRRLAVAGYWEWVLGELRGRNLMHIVTEIDGRSGALLARNPYHPDFPERIAFVDCSEPRRSCSGDRAEILGRGGSLERPRGLAQARLSDRVGAGLDPCAAMLVPIELPPDGEGELVFVLGVGHDVDDVQQLIQRFRSVSSARRTLDQVWDHWKRHVEAIQVETPDPSVDVLANGWLPYQVLACRCWARTGFYQSGGAFGFRDQLQDSMALLPAAPGLARAHLLRAAAHQFREGDAQHWWHPPADRGVRTHISDDYLWLPYAAAHYARTTADTGVFDELVPFIEGRALRPDEESCFDKPVVSSDRATLYEHCRLALDRACGRLGRHALPLIGGGDWNDGMNLVGECGQGESVWLGWFLADCLRRFAPVAQARGDTAAVQRWLLAAAALAYAIESEAWDGDWYRRAWFDDGRLLGSATSAECRIDSLPQSWAVLSGAGEPGRALHALDAVDTRLVDRQARLIRLFDPPFDRSDLEPGYIKGYVPGVRENGGQYPHAAVWVAMAFARVGNRARAWELFALLNPVKHGGSPEAAAVYRVEPYVVAADVYGVAPHVGRGGWSWYTGSAGWLYRLLIEDLLGVRREGDRLLLTPRPPPGWPGFAVHYRHYRTVYHIVVTCAGGDATLRRLRLDGNDVPGNAVPLIDDGRDHQVDVELA
jgi:cyclic beta-1,2-glucan synthetase